MAVAAALAFLVAFCAVRIILKWFAGFALDEPNTRSMHERAVPRTGGIAVLLGAAVSLAAGGASLWLLFACAIVLAAVSFVDDVRGIAATARLAAHAAIACVAVWLLAIQAHPVTLVLLVIAVVWVTNLFNFMDGSDGFAGGMTVFGFGTYAIGAAAAGHEPIAAVSAAIAAGAGAFLLHNFHPARIFLGDVGAIPLGFLAAVIGLRGWSEGAWPLWFPLLVFGTFNADATITLLKRLARRERPWQAHRDHYYQRIARMGFGHRRTALIGYALMLICSAAALYGRSQPAAMQAASFLAATLVLAAVALWVDVRWTRFSARSEGRP
jgi:UDP-N-acetylmuramyl pentapeptide phosphotransferase/UDP-N-acetylglucosamine-1-phosphate transferase